MDNRAKELLTELMDILDIEEESDSGTIFHPVHISSCRCMLTQKVSDLLKKINKEIGRG